MRLMFNFILKAGSKYRLGNSHTNCRLHQFIDFIMIRPELRYDHAWNNNHIMPFNNGTKAFQFTVATDLCISF